MLKSENILISHLIKRFYTLNRNTGIYVYLCLFKWILLFLHHFVNYTIKPHHSLPPWSFRSSILDENANKPNLNKPLTFVGCKSYNIENLMVSKNVGNKHFCPISKSGRNIVWYNKKRKSWKTKKNRSCTTIHIIWMDGWWLSYMVTCLKMLIQKKKTLKSLIICLARVWIRLQTHQIYTCIMRFFTFLSFFYSPENLFCNSFFSFFIS